MRRRVDDMAEAISKAHSNRLVLWRERMIGLDMRLGALNPGAILHRGYSIVQRQLDGEVVSRKGQVSRGEELQVRVSDGVFPATVGSTPTKRRTGGVKVRAGARLL